MKKIIALVFVSLALSACGSGFGGRYDALQGAYSMDFHSDGYVSHQVMGNTLGEYPYEKNGDLVNVYMVPGISQVYRIRDKNILVGPGGVNLIKREEY